ncbi:S-layer family protein [Nostoc flagelliforme FACHB-838]|uniref:S-layer family protein n=1 Tax=Nostoc flagelliforme FACHB-838 TaxID=2692904 RepID=A0ABR8E3S3_9NOSO|nr:S-layer family protein [Nostoc flagelliforme]MBD2536281.1 S-layer family protein [Nostoc flagelliforme FACHB-838]
MQLIGISVNGSRVNSTLAASALIDSTGNAGNLTIKANTLLVKDGAQVSTSTFGAGKGGNLTVDAQNVQLIGESTLSADAQPYSTGNAGDLTIKANTLLVKDGAQVSTSTFSASKGGNLTVDAQNVQLIGGRADGQGSSGLFARSRGTGNAGSISITTRQLIIRDQAQVTVSGTDAGTGTAGSLKVDANSIYLNNAAKITADTTGGGGDISLRSPLLLLRNQSSITTNARGSGIPGGNIKIDATDGFIIAVPREDSDISANSADFRGGKVEISAQGIFGIQRRNTLTPESDITATGASPEFSGSVELNTPGVDPNSGLVELPTIGVETEVAQVCDSPGYAQSSFIITGRGGLPPNPTKDILPANTVEVGWISPKPSNDANSGRRYANDGLRLRSNPPVTRASTTMPERIVEASGWALNEKGEVVLTANVTAGGRGSWHKGVPCSVSQAAHQ